MEQPTLEPVTKAIPVHLRFLDGMRGLAALYVVFHHAAIQIPTTDLGPFAQYLRRFFMLFGQDSVCVFIVLSGYCLMLPVMKSADGYLRGGFKNYIWRRARRIIPPYYAAIALVLALIALVPVLGTPNETRWDASLPVFKADVILSHLLLVHNFSKDLVYKIDPPMWSVATEWQIYLVFPFMLRIRSRFGLKWAVAFSFALGYGITSLRFFLHDISWRIWCPWFIGLFALGLAAATVDVQTLDTGGRAKSTRRWGWLAAALSVLVLLGHFKSVTNFLIDPFIGMATSCLIIWLALRTYEPSSERRPWLHRLLESRVAVVLGHFSYSLYLIHFPLICLINLVLLQRGFSDADRFYALLIFGPATSLAVGWFFHLAFEKPFMSFQPSKNQMAVVQLPAA